MKEACRMWFSVICSVSLGMLLVFGAYCIGTATKTHVTFIVERLPIQDTYQDVVQETAAKASITTPPKGIEITALPKPIRKPAIPVKP